MQCEYNSNVRGHMCHLLHVRSNVLRGKKQYAVNNREISDGKVGQSKTSIGQAEKPGGSINEICTHMYITYYLLEVTFLKMYLSKEY